ncbi:MAG: HYR domain-containing protein, partial [Planctomycetota bacterium]|nr:HYR domain-containing protein [Planctomycetota bacterium]
MSTGKPRFVPTRDWRRVSILLFAALCLHTPPARAQLSSSCLGSDPSNNSSCYAGRSNTELELLIRGTPTIPFDPPEVCGVVVTTPGIARSVLTGDACLRLRREALTLTFNIRRSVIFGDGLFGQDRVSCYEDAPPFSIVLRCGDVFVPNPNTADPNDALTVGQQTAVSDLLSGSLALCDLAGCPALATDPCGATIGRLAMIMHEVNDSRRQDGNCPLCPGDLIPPALACPAGPLVFECEQPAGATINYTVTVADNCDPLPSLVCFPPPGTLLPLGPRTVQCDAQDLRGNLTTCTFDVQIVDTTPPAIQCPAERIVVDCVPGLQNGAIVNFPPPVATDICDLSPTVTCTPPSGSFFLFGLTTVTCTATDDSGNQSFCSVLIEVVEQTPVQLFCSGDVTVECTSSGGMVVSYPAPMISDTCDPPPAPICTPPSGSLFPLGTTAVTCATQTADGLPLSCQFNVNVVDTQAPTIVCPLDITVECAAPSGTRVLFDVPATDACDASPAVTCVPPSGTIFPPGLTSVLCTATDASGNQAQCTFSVLVRDTTPPRLTCPQGPITVGCDVQGTPPSAVVNYASPAVTDNCDPAVAVTCSPLSGSLFPLGITTVTCTATDASLNQSVCT